MFIEINVAWPKFSFPTQILKLYIEVLHGGHFACQEQYNNIPMGQNVHSNAKHFHRSWHATWPPCKTSISTVKRCSLPSYPYPARLAVLKHCTDIIPGNMKFCLP